MNLLKLYGVTDQYINEASMYENLKLARIIAQYKGMYKIITDIGEKQGKISGKLRYETTELAKLPAVGDYVMVSYTPGDDVAIIEHILKRKSVFLRTAVGISEEEAQVIAANIDIVFICMSLNNNYNLNRLERYLAITWDSGATPVIVLTKTDLSESLAHTVAEVEQVSLYCDVIATSMFEDNSNKFAPYLKAGITTAFVGSSGVGKTTLIKQFLQKELITKEIGKGDKGKHTTTGREMFVSPLGGVVIDTPGMREIGAQNVDLAKSFADIEELAKLCKFNDCAHKGEPECAVQKALLVGKIEQRRLDSYFRLKNESSYDGLNSKQIEAKKIERMFKEVGGMKNARKLAKAKRKRK